MIDKKSKYINFGLLLLAVVALVFVPAVSANEGYFAALQSVYGTTGTSCGTCHIDPNGGGPRNDYGTLFENQPNHSADPTAALQAIGAPASTGVPASPSIGAPGDTVAELSITAPADITQVATGTLTNITLGTAETSGGNGSVNVTNDASAEGFPVGVTEVIWTATDSTGAMVTATQNVTIIEEQSNLTITAPADITQVTTGNVAIIADIGVPTISGGIPPYTTMNDAPMEGNFAVGETIVTWTVNDSANTVATATQKVTITEALSNLTIIAPEDITRVATGNLTTITDLGTST